MSVRERAAAALDDDFPAVLAALRRGLEDRDAGKAARTAVAYVQLVYGPQLQQPADEQPDPLDVSSMTIWPESDLVIRSAPIGPPTPGSHEFTAGRRRRSRPSRPRMLSTWRR
jgi:hypothetical protein